MVPLKLTWIYTQLLYLVYLLQRTLVRFNHGVLFDATGVHLAPVGWPFHNILRAEHVRYQEYSSVYPLRALRVPLKLT